MNISITLGIIGLAALSLKLTGFLLVDWIFILPLFAPVVFGIVCIVAAVIFNFSFFGDEDGN